MTIISALPFDLLNGTTADATQVDANFNEIVNDVNNNAAHNGVNSDITALTALTLPIPPAGGGTNVYIAGTSGGTANAQTVASPTPTGFTLIVGNRICFVAGFTNTAAMTLSVNGTTATAVVQATPSGTEPLVGGEIIAGAYIECIYDGTNYELYTNVVKPGIGPLTSLASATTTDLGTISSHNILITGTTTITGFGSSAIVGYPIYRLQFSGILNLTYNATSMILPGAAGITTAVGDSAVAQYLGSGDWQIISYFRASNVANVNPTLIQGYLSGLTLSTAGGSGTFGIAAGTAVDSTHVSSMVLASAFTKTTASWAVGSGNGALDTGSIAATTWYHVFEIQRLDTGLVDILFSLSAISPTMPTNYTLFRRIGSMKTDGSSHWLAFTQMGDVFVWAVSTVDFSGASTNARVATALGVPTAITVSATFRAGLILGAGTGSTIFTSLLETDQGPVTGAQADLSSVGGGFANGSFERVTNTSAQIGVKSNNTGFTVTVETYGWKDNRGK